MKKSINLMALFAVVAMLISCGSSKTAAPNYQQQLQQQNVQQRPSRSMRTVDPCIELASANSDHYRAYGTSTSYVEKVARNEAARDARNQLAQMMKVAIEGAAQDYERNAAQNLDSSAGSLGEAVMSQVVKEEVNNSPIIKTSIYDLSDGSIQVYVCVEMRTDKAGFEKKLENVLSREGFLELQFDRDRFIEKMKEGLEEQKKKDKR